MRMAFALIALAACGDDGVLGSPRWEVTLEAVTDLAVQADGDVVATNLTDQAPLSFVHRIDGETGEVEWTVEITGDYVGVSSVAVGPDGGVAITGDFEGSTDFGGETLEAAGDGESFVASYDAGGALRWARSLGPGAGSDAGQVVVTSTGMIVTNGRFDGTLGSVTADDLDEYVVAHDPAGEVAWIHAAPLPEAQLPGDLAVAPDGDLVAGGKEGAPVVRLAPDGQVRWTLPFAGGGRQLAFEAGGELIVTGRDPDRTPRMWRLDASGAELASFELWRSDLGILDLAVAPGGELVMGASEDLGEGVPEDGVIAVLDRDGRLVDQLWLEDTRKPYQVAVGSDGTIAFTSGYVVVAIGPLKD